MNSANYCVCPFCQWDYNTGLCLPKFLPWGHTAWLSCLTRAELMDMDFEWAKCQEVFNIGDPTDLPEDRQTIDVIETIKEREKLTSRDRRQVYSRDKNNYFTPIKHQTHRGLRTEYRPQAYRHNDTYNYFRPNESSQMEVDGEPKHRFTHSSNKDMETDKPKLTPFYKSNTEPFRTPAAKLTVNPFTPAPKRASTFFPKTVKKDELKDTLEVASKWARENCANERMRKTSAFPVTNSKPQYISQYWSEECKNYKESQQNGESKSGYNPFKKSVTIVTPNQNKSKNPFL